MMLNCKEVTELCSEEMERKLPMRERIFLRMHLAMCSGCRHFRSHMGFIRQAARKYAEGGAASDRDTKG